MRTINKKLFATAGMFVALCALTSFNPFTQATHLAALDSEQSLSLAQSSPSHRSELGNKNHNNDRKRDQTTAPGLAEAKRLTDQDPKTEKVEADEAKGSQSSNSEGGTCADGKCENKQKAAPTESLAELGTELRSDCLATAKKRSEALDAKVAKLSDEDKIAKASEIEDLRSKIKTSEAQCGGEVQSSVAETDGITVDAEDEVNLCVDGTYKQRLSCLKKIGKAYSKKGSGATDEDIGRVGEGISQVVIDASRDEEISEREIRRIKDLAAKASREIKDSDVRNEVAQTIRTVDQDIQVRRQESQIAARLNMYTQNIEAFDMAIMQAQQQGNYFQVAQLQAQRKWIVLGLEADVSAHRQFIRSSLPMQNDRESRFVSELRDERAARYQELVANVSPAFNDQRLASLDAQIINTPGTPAQNGDVMSSGNPTGTNPINPTTPTYSSSNLASFFTGVPADVLLDSPARQASYHQSNGGYRATNLNTIYNGNYQTTYNNVPGQQYQPVQQVPRYGPY